MPERTTAPCRHCGRPVVRTHEHGWGHLARTALACRTPEPRPAAAPKAETPEGEAPDA